MPEQQTTLDGMLAVPEAAAPGGPDPVVGALEELRKAAAERRVNWVADIEMTLAFLAGNQWVHYSLSRGIQEIANEANEIRKTDNRMLPAFRRWQFYLHKSQPTITAFEGGEELKDAEVAAVSAKLCDYWDANNGWVGARREWTAWMGVTGIGFLAPVWRVNRNRKVKRTKLTYQDEGGEDGSGRRVFLQETPVEAYAGDLAFEVYCPLQTYLYPLDARSWDRVGGVMTVDVVDFAYVRDELGFAGEEEELEPVKPEAVNLEVLRRINDFVGPEFGLMSDVEPEKKRYLVMQWFERPTKDRTAGRYLLVAGGKVLKDSTLPYVREARSIDPGDVHNITMGIVPVMAMEFPGRLLPPAPMGELRSAQAAWNDLLTDEAANRRTVGRNKLIYEQGTLDEEAWTAEHGEKIALRPGTSAKPQYVQGMPLAGIENEKATVMQAFDEQSGQTAVLRGQNPAQVRAAFHLDILREESMAPMYAQVQLLERSHELAARLALAIAKRRYTSERIVEIYGQDQAGRALTFKTACINTDVRVKVGSMLPRNHAVRTAQLTELLQYGAFLDDVTGKPNNRKFWKMIELGTMNQSVDPEEAQRNRARAENTQMLVYGTIIAPLENEDHDLHIEEHRAGMARPEWYRAPENVQAVTMGHLEAHRRMLADQVAPESGMASGALPGLGMGPAGQAVEPKPDEAGLALVQGLEQPAAGGGGQQERAA